VGQSREPVTIAEARMRPLVFGLALWFASGCSGNSHASLCPKHIETPVYPTLARQTRITGKIMLTVTIGARGNVTNVEASTNDPLRQKFPILQKSAIENMQRWTFAKPPLAPYRQTIEYDYIIDESLPPQADASTVITKVSYDLPERVTIAMNTMTVNW
jgi:TonB family protein